MKRRSWKDSEVQRLQKLAGNGKTWADIKTEFHGRSIQSLMRKWDKLKGGSVKVNVITKACAVVKAREMKLLEGDRLVTFREVLI